jgi:hypothetical protein
MIKKMKTVNVCTTAALWTIWKLRNEFCFQDPGWSGMHVLFRSSARMLRDWKLVNKQEDAAVLGSWADELERSRLPPRLPWNDHQGALFDGVSDPVRVLNDDQVELDFLNSVPDVGSVVVRPVRPLPEGVRPDMATHELYDLNLVL